MLIFGTTPDDFRTSILAFLLKDSNHLQRLNVSDGRVGGGRLRLEHEGLSVVGQSLLEPGQLPRGVAEVVEERFPLVGHHAPVADKLHLTQRSREILVGHRISEMKLKIY